VIPSDIKKHWRKCAWIIAGAYSFSPDKIMNLFIDDFIFWVKGALWLKGIVNE
jgi:hypothetical protein